MTSDVGDPNVYDDVCRYDGGCKMGDGWFIAGVKVDGGRGGGGGGGISVDDSEADEIVLDLPDVEPDSDGAAATFPFDGTAFSLPDKENVQNTH